MRQVAKERPVKVAWKLFSLAVVNHGSNYNAEAHAKGFRLERAMLAARRHGGNDALERLYIAFGNAIHGSKEDLADPSVIRRCLREAGLPEDLYERALEDASTETDLLAEHNDAVVRLQAFGVPTLSLNESDRGLFGPVVEPVPRDGKALELWDHTLWLLQNPTVWEFKRQARVKLGPQYAID